MGMTKEQIEERLRRVQALADRVILKRRLDWLNLVLHEAGELGFSSLGELIVFMVNYSKDMEEKYENLTKMTSEGGEKRSNK
jgi:hypothetical protein